MRLADGTVASVWEKWLAFSADPLYLSLYARWDPGVVQRRHGHLSPHVVMVLEGEIDCGGRRCPAGTHIELPQGAAFGPFEAGPEGAVLFEVMMGDPRGWGDDPASFERLLALRGAEALPDPPSSCRRGWRTCGGVGWPTERLRTVPGVDGRRVPSTRGPCGAGRPGTRNERAGRARPPCPP